MNKTTYAVTLLNIWNSQTTPIGVISTPARIRANTTILFAGVAYLVMEHRIEVEATLEEALAGEGKDGYTESILLVDLKQFLLQRSGGTPEDDSKPGESPKAGSGKQVNFVSKEQV